MEPYYIPAGDSETEFTEKRSRFIGHVAHVTTEEQARDFVTAMKKRYHDARHNCWCYLLREEGVVRYSDDGEPQGTAGQPMLNVFQRQGVTDVVCVVTRYFGGVLLGAGGLVRAYTRSARDAMEVAGICVVRRWVCMDVPCDYSRFARIQQETEAMEGVVRDTEYGAEVTLRVLLPEERWEAYRARIIDLSAGTVTPRVTGEALVPVPLSKEGVSWNGSPIGTM